MAIKTKKEGVMLVQGDVFLIRTDKDITGMKKIGGRDGRLVLAEGEATGHHHSIQIQKDGSGIDYTTLWEDPRNKTLYLEATKEVTLTHQEHNPIAIAPGTYKVGIVQEYDYFLEEARKVVD